MGNRTRSLLSCGGVLQPTALLRAPNIRLALHYCEWNNCLMNVTNKQMKVSKQTAVMPVSTIKAYRGNRSIDPLILNFCPNMSLVVSRRLGGTRRRSRCFGEEKNVLPLPGFELRTVQLVP